MLLSILRCNSNANVLLQRRNKAAAAWTKWECSTSRLLVDADMVKKASDDAWAYAFARIEWYTLIPMRALLSVSNALNKETHATQQPLLCARRLVHA